MKTNCWFCKNMKKYILFCILVIATLLSSCSDASIESKIDRENVVFGLVETQDSAEKSKITWYDLELEVIGSFDYQYANLGSNFYTPTQSGDEVYLIPRGLGGHYDTKKIIGIKRDDFSIIEYPFTNIALNHVAVIEEAIYAVNTLNTESTIERYDKQTESHKSVVVEDTYVYSIIAAGDKLFCFANELLDYGNKYLLRVYDYDLNLLDVIDISDYGMTSMNYYQDNEYLYVTIPLSVKDEPVSKILKIDKDNYSMDIVEGVGHFPYNIYSYQDQWIIVNYDPVIDQGTELTILDKDGKFIQSIDLNNTLTLTEIYDDKLIVANPQKIAIYSLDSFNLLTEKDIKISEKSYLSAIITWGSKLR